MNYYSLFLLIMFFSKMSAQSVDSVIHLGGPFTLTEITPIRDLTGNPGKYYNRNVKIEGVIASACMQEGCFIEVVEKDGSGEGILVNFPDLVYTFPTHCAGRTVIVEGMFYQKIYPASRVLHWQGHSYRKGKHVPEFSLIKRITAKAVDIKGEKASIPKPADIPDASIDRINLNTMEFEADGLGTGKKILLPGEMTDEHSTGKNREMILCLEGTLSIVKGNLSPYTISAGEMAYIPPETKHTIINKTESPAVYIFVYSRQPENEKTTHDH
jgi:quercetin dioxygenase-like cupin family protein